MAGIDVAPATAQTAKPLRAAIVGAGQWAVAAHLPALRACPGVDLVAIADADRERAARVASEHGIGAAFGCASDLLDVARPHLLVVATPDDQHAEPAAPALARGVHVLCEKPLGRTLQEARALADAAAQAPVVTRVGFTMRFAPALAHLKRLVDDGAIGPLQHLQAFQQNGQFIDPATPFHWKMDGARTGGGAVVEYGIHTLDLARWIAGEATAVSAVARTLVPQRPAAGGAGSVPVRVDDSTAWLLAFANGATGLCHAGWATAGRGPGLEVRVFGPGGGLRCVLSDDLPGAEGLWRAGPDGAFVPIPLPDRATSGANVPPWWVRFARRQAAEFVDAIHGGGAGGPTFADGLRAQEVLDATLRAAAERRWVEISPPAPGR